MKVGVRQFVMVGSAIATSFLTVGCATGKVAQCASTIEVVNRTVKQTETVTAAGTKGDLATIEKLVTIFDTAAKDLNSVNVSDEKLKDYKNKFFTMYQGGTEITKQLVSSIKEKKSTKVHEGLRKSRTIFSPEQALAAGLTRYCKEPEK
jgi:hypothetical protein